MALRLFLLFTLVPALELACLVYIGTLIGPLPTLALVLLAAVLGSWLARREGFAVLRQLQEDLKKGLPPATRLVEGALVLTGAVLLITPGVWTDVVGFTLLIPPTRRWLAPRVLRYLVRRFGVKAQEVRGDAPDGAWTAPVAEPEPADRHFDHPVR